MFINTACLYLRMKMTDKVATTQVAWVLSYVQGGIAEAQKDNLLDKLAKRESEVNTVEKLFSKIRNDFGEILKEAWETEAHPQASLVMGSRLKVGTFAKCLEM